jgi:hypothetical protein
MPSTSKRADSEQAGREPRPSGRARTERKPEALPEPVLLRGRAGAAPAAARKP